MINDCTLEDLTMVSLPILKMTVPRAPPPNFVSGVFITRGSTRNALFFLGAVVLSFTEDIAIRDLVSNKSKKKYFDRSHM